MPGLEDVTKYITFQSPFGDLGSVGKYLMGVIVIFALGFVLYLIARKLRMTQEEYDDDY